MQTLIMLILISLLGACGKPNDTPPIKIMESQRQQLQKAKEVDNLVQEATKKQNQAIDAQITSQTEK